MVIIIRNNDNYNNAPLVNINPIQSTGSSYCI